MMRILRRLRRRRHTSDRCEICGAYLKPRQTVTLESWFDCGEGTGGTSMGSMTATYCKRDAPREAKP